MGLFDDLIPQGTGFFDDLIPGPGDTPQPPADPVSARTMDAPGMPQSRPTQPVGALPGAMPLPDAPMAPEAPEMSFAQMLAPMLSPQPRMNPALNDTYVPDVPFDPRATPQPTEFPEAPPEESLGELMTRRGQQFVGGLTDFVASQPEDMAVGGRRFIEGRLDDAAASLPALMEERQAIEQVLAQVEPDSPEAQAYGELLALNEQQMLRVAQPAERMEAQAQVPVQETPLFQAGTAVRGKAADVFGEPDPNDQSFWGDVATGLGNAAGFVGTAVAGGPFGIPLGAAAGANMNQSAVYQEAIEAGADRKVAAEASRYAAIVGASEIIPITRAIKLLLPRMRGQVTNRLMRDAIDIAQAGGEEAFQEFWATVANNMIAQNLYDPERGAWDGAVDGASVGAVVGALLGGGGVSARRYAERGQDGPAAPDAPAAPPPLPAPEAPPMVPQPTAEVAPPDAPPPMQEPGVTPEAPVAPPQPVVEPQAPVSAPVVAPEPEPAPAPPPAQPEAVPEPESVRDFADTPELRLQRPLTQRIRGMGGIMASQVDPETGQRRPTMIAQELAARGITPRTHPSLFNNRTGMRDIDNLDPDSLSSEARQLFPMAEDGLYLDRQGMIDALAAELTGGQPQFLSMEARQATQDYQAAVQEAGRIAEAPIAPEIAATDPFVVSEGDFFGMSDSQIAEAVESVVAAAEQQIGVPLTPQERQAVASRLSRGGDALAVIESELVRSIQNEITQAADQPTSDIPFPAAEDAGVSRDAEPDATEPGRDPGAQAEGRAVPEDGRGAGESAPEPTTELTPEGEQTVIPGAEARPAGEGRRTEAQQRAQAEAKVKAQQSKMRTSTPQAAAGPLFNDQTTLLDAPTRVGRRPKGRLGPDFIDFSFTSRPSVYDHALRAAGLDPKTAVNLPIERQLSAVTKAVEDTFGIKVEVPTKTVRKKNRFGRMVAEQVPDLSPRKAVDQLLNAYRNLQMLAHVMQMPANAIGLPVNGQPVTLSLVSKGKLKGALGMYAYGAGKRTIYLPDMSNSFAHEWAHALDHYMSLMADQPMFKGLMTRDMMKQGVQPPLSPKRALTDAFAHIIWSMFGDGRQIGALRLQLQVESAQLGADGLPTPKATRAMKILTDMREGRMPPKEYLSDYFRTSDAFAKMNGDNGYFTDPAEMFARAFEAMIGTQIAAISDMPQSFLSKGDWAYTESQDTRAQLTFPKGIDLAQFVVAMGNLSQAMNRITLHGPFAPAAVPANHETMGTRELLQRQKEGALGSLTRREAEGWAETINTLRELPSSVRPAMENIAEGADRIYSQAIRTGAATLFAIADRQQNPKAREALTNIAKAVGKRPGKGKLTENLWEEQVRRKHGVVANKLEGALKKALRAMNVRSLKPSHLSELRYLLSGQAVSKADPAIKELATDMRKILNDIWYDLQGANVEVAYESSYLPHIYDGDIASKEPAKFRKAAKQVYELMFQREIIDNADIETQMKDVNTIIRGLRNASEATAEGNRDPAPRLTETDETIIKTYRDAQKKLRGLERQQEKSDDPDKFVDKIAEQSEIVEEARAEMLDMLQDRWSEYSAESWSIRMAAGELNDFGGIGPSANFLKGRVLPREAGIIMQDFMHRNPVELVLNYSMNAAKKAEYARVFGHDNAKLKAMLDAAAEAGATKNDLDMVKMGVNAATGRMMPSGTGWQTFKTTTFVLGNMALLTRAAMSSIAEPMTVALRSGAISDSGRAFASTFIKGWHGGYRREMQEIARTIGLILPYAQDSLMQNRLGMDVMGNRPALQNMVQKFFVINGLTPLTHYQRAMLVPVANAIILRHLRATVRGQRGIFTAIRDKIDGEERGFSNSELNELGIAEGARKDMLEWLDSVGGMPSAADLFGPDGQTMHKAGELWSRATYRLATESIQDPLKTDRTFMSNHPDHSAMYGIMSFIDSFTRNILWRNLERGIKDQDSTLKAGAKMTANAALMTAPMGALIVGQILTGIVREAVFNADKMRELEEDDEEDLWEWLVLRGFYRSGALGRLDPLANFVTGVRYQNDLSSMFAGPYVTYFAKQMEQVIVAALGRNSPNTNTAEFNALSAAYRLMAQPVLTAAISSAAPAGPVSINAARVALAYLTSPTTVNDFSEMLVGEKGTTYRGDPPWWEMGN